MNTSYIIHNLKIIHLCCSKFIKLILHNNFLLSSNTKNISSSINLSVNTLSMSETNKLICTFTSTWKTILTNYTNRSKHNIYTTTSIMTVSKYKIIFNMIFAINNNSIRKFSRYKYFSSTVKTTSSIPYSFIWSNSVIKELKSINVLNYFILRFNKS